MENENVFIVLDVDSYRNAKKIAWLHSLSKVESLRTNLQDQISPMSPFRRIIHMALSKPEFNDILTEISAREIIEL